LLDHCVYKLDLKYVIARVVPCEKKIGIYTWCISMGSDPFMLQQLLRKNNTGEPAEAVHGGLAMVKPSTDK
jgi:hypothetical protein